MITYWVNWCARQGSNLEPVVVSDRLTRVWAGSLIAPQRALSLTVAGWYWNSCRESWV